MKKLAVNPFYVLSLLLLSLVLISGCSKTKDSKDKGAVDSKKENTNSESGSGTTSGDSDVNGMIKDYESLMNEYVQIVEAVKSGDVSEITKMKDLSLRLSEWAKKFADLDHKLTDEQRTRIREIADKTGEAVK